MSALLIENAEGIFTGLAGDAMRAQGSIRIRDGIITAIGVLTPESGERRLDASGCVIYPGLISTHHHLFQSVLKGVQAGINRPLAGWLRSVPYAYWSKIDEEALAVAARIGLTELLLSGTTTVADHHYLFSDTYRFDPAAVILHAISRRGIGILDLLQTLAQRRNLRGQATHNADRDRWTQIVAGTCIRRLENRDQ